jgi:hypothetical protein
MEDRISLYPNEPILVATLDTTFSVTRDMSTVISQATQILDSVEQPVFYIVDVRQMRVTFEDLVASTNASARGDSSYLHHPNIRELIVVSTDRLVTLGVKGLQAPVFGIGALSVFGTLEEALAYCREKVAVA